MEASVNARGFRKCTQGYSSCVPLFVFVSSLEAEKNKAHVFKGPTMPLHKLSSGRNLEVILWRCHVTSTVDLLSCFYNYS